MAMASEQFMQLLEAQRASFITGYVELVKTQCHEWALAAASQRRHGGEAADAGPGDGGADDAGEATGGADNVKTKIQCKESTATVEAKMVGGKAASGGASGDAASTLQRAMVTDAQRGQRCEDSDTINTVQLLSKAGAAVGTDGDKEIADEVSVYSQVLAAVCAEYDKMSIDAPRATGLATAAENYYIGDDVEHVSIIGSERDEAFEDDDSPASTAHGASGGVSARDEVTVTADDENLVGGEFGSERDEETLEDDGSRSAAAESEDAQSRAERLLSHLREALVRAENGDYGKALTAFARVLVDDGEGKLPDDQLYAVERQRVRGGWQATVSFASGQQIAGEVRASSSSAVKAAQEETMSFLGTFIRRLGDASAAQRDGSTSTSNASSDIRRAAW